MPNIKFSYLYRDAANYKNFSFVIFGGDEGIRLSYLQSLIQSKLIDGTWFYAGQWELPDLHFNNWNDEFDHTFHEFECIEYTDEAPNTLLNLAEFQSIIEHTYF
jgi:hypothetical protein